MAPRERELFAEGFPEREHSSRVKPNPIEVDLWRGRKPRPIRSPSRSSLLPPNSARQGRAAGRIYFVNDFMAVASSSFTSKTVYSLVIWSRS